MSGLEHRISQASTSHYEEMTKVVQEIERTIHDINNRMDNMEDKLYTISNFLGVNIE